MNDTDEAIDKMIVEMTGLTPDEILKKIMREQGFKTYIDHDGVEKPLQDAGYDSR